MGRFWVFFLSHTDPGFQLWFYFHLCMWVIHWDLAPEAVMEDLGLPQWGPGVEVVQLLGSQGFWQHQVLRAVGGGKGSRKYSALEGYGNQYWPILSSILAWRNSLTKKPGRSQSTGSQRVGQDRNDPENVDISFILPVAALPQWGLTVTVAQLLGLWGPWWHQTCRATACLHHRSCGWIRVFFWASCSWGSEHLFGQSFSLAPPIQALRGLPCLRSFSVVPYVRHIEGPPWLGSYSVDWWVRHLKGHPGWGPAL